MVDLGKLFGNVDPRKLNTVVEFVWESKDDLIAAAKFATQLPELLINLSTGLQEASRQARLASVALVGEDGKGGMMASMSKGSTSLGAVSGTLGKTSGLINKVADEFGKVPLMGGPAKQLTGTAAGLTGAGADLAGFGEDLINMAGALAQVASALAALGESLDTTSKKARSIIPA